ncbi:hypothetical protein Tco_0607603 [Tanacetum coccineum]
MDREVKQLKKSRIPIVKVRWNPQRGLEFTWEREDQFKSRYPHLFTSKPKVEWRIEHRDDTLLRGEGYDISHFSRTVLGQQVDELITKYFWLIKAWKTDRDVEKCIRWYLGIPSSEDLNIPSLSAIR